MANKLYEENSVQAIAESIRSKLGVDTTYKISEMAGAINTIVKPTGTTNITENGYHNVKAYEQAYVQVQGGITPTGTMNIPANGDYDVTNYAEAHVAVPQPVGKKTVTENGTDIDIAQYATLDVVVEPNVDSKTINQNGVYKASDDNLDGYSQVNVSTPVPTGKKTITQNGTDIDISSYALADVIVPQPTGKKTITQNGTDIDIAQYATADVQVDPNVGMKSITDNGTYNASADNLDGYSSVTVNIPQYGKPIVPQTGTWQYKKTYPCGFLIIGKDDDTADSAMFVRMVNGYGFPVTLNSTQQFQNNTIYSDADTEYSTYPEGSYANFPNGGTINQLNKFVIKEHRGEIALHGVGAEKIWDSTNLTGTVLDNYYETYTTGGGTKTKEEFKTAFIEKYASMDVAQSAPIVAQKRLLMQSAVDNWLYTVGTWGGNFDVIIDNINCGESGPVNSTTQSISRSQNWMGDGQLNNQILTKGANPYWIYRDSGALTADNIQAACELAYNNRVCIDAFHHYYLDGSAEKWNNFKTTLDTIKSYYDQGKIYVVTRKQYYDLGEFVEHAITSVSLETKSFAYGVGHVFTENDFNIAANLDNGTSIACENDKILYLDGIDTTTEGIYTAKIEYRGKFGQCSVTISNDIPSSFLLENYSASGTGMPRTANLTDATISPAISFVNGKSYRYQFHVRINTEVQYSTHYITFEAPLVGSYAGWRTTTTDSIETINGVTEGDISFDITVNRDQDVDVFCMIRNILNTTVGEWTISNGYIYEIDSTEGGE